MGAFYLTLSDSAKLASSAKHYLEGLGYVSGHNFFDRNRLALYRGGEFLPADLPPLPVLLLSQFFKFFGASDGTVALAGTIFGVVCLWLVFLIGRKLFGLKVGLLATIFTLSSVPLITYSLNFATEIVFTLEILLFVYVFISQHKLRYLAEILIVGLMMLTRQQAFIFLFGVLLIWLHDLWTHPRVKRNLKILATTGCLLLVFGWWMQSKTNTNAFISPARLLGAVNIPTGESQGQYLRGTAIPELPSRVLVSKTFYNLYNFLIAPDRIAPSLLVWLFSVGIFMKMPNFKARSFYNFCGLITLLSLVAAAITLPNARYLHPLVPLLSIGASFSMDTLLKKIHINFRWLALTTSVVFMTLPSFGHWFIDSRFRRNIYNFERPPASRVIAAKMAEHIEPGNLVLTNLDAWASWYSNMNTMWFPTNPEQIRGLEHKINYIFITTYLENDQDFSLNEWGKLLDDPQSIETSDLGQYFDPYVEFVIPKTYTYENREIRGVIFVNAKK